MKKQGTINNYLRTVNNRPAFPIYSILYAVYRSLFIVEHVVSEFLLTRKNNERNQVSVNIRSEYYSFRFADNNSVYLRALVNGI
jgi:argonaute-like protein implicated in RNA metabolism and viral defense